MFTGIVREAHRQWTIRAVTIGSAAVLGRNRWKKSRAY
jgi:hypothetical protein